MRATQIVDCYPVSSMSGGYYVWTANGKNVRVHLALKLVNRLNTTAVDGVRGSSSPAGEIAGVLYGNVSTDGVVHDIFVEEFVPMDPLPTALAPSNHRRPVGLFRSRPGGELRLDRSDAARIESLCKKPDLIYLLVQPVTGAPTRAGIFIEEDGRVHGFATYREFPLDAVLLRSGEFAAAVETAPPPAAVAPKRYKPAIASGLACVALAGGAVPIFLHYRTSARAPMIISSAGPVTQPVNAPASNAVASKPAIQAVKIEPVLPKRGRARRNFVPPEPMVTNLPPLPDPVARSLRVDVPMHLKLRLDRAGHIAKVQIVNAPKDPQFSRLAKEGVAGWRFKPARQSRRAVESDVLAHFSYRPALPSLP